ncbi:MAG: DUF624 domain-containing protein [Firmicutes bacterium]|nr:DUF624 domain-containing protein [Bacillota bacterium]
MERRPPVSIWGFTRAGFAAAYEHLGMVLVGSALWFVIGFTPLLFLAAVFYKSGSLVVSAPAVLLVLLTLGPATAGAYSLFEPLIWPEGYSAETSLRRFFQGFRRFYWKSVGLGALNALLLAIFLGDMAFFLRSAGLSKALAVVFLYFVLFQVLMSNFYFSFLVHQKNSVLNVLKKSALVVLDNTWASLVLSLEVAILFILSLIIPPVLVVLFMGLAAFLQLHAFRMILDRYPD